MEKRIHAGMSYPDISTRIPDLPIVAGEARGSSAGNQSQHR